MEMKLYLRVDPYPEKINSLLEQKGIGEQAVTLEEVKRLDPHLYQELQISAHEKFVYGIQGTLLEPQFKPGNGAGFESWIVTVKGTPEITFVRYENFAEVDRWRAPGFFKKEGGNIDYRTGRDGLAVATSLLRVTSETACKAETEEIPFVLTLGDK